MSLSYRSIAANWYRLIPSRFPPVDIYARVAPPEDWPAYQSVEEQTNPRVQAKRTLIGDTAVDSVTPALQNWNHAPFTYLNPEGSWFLDEVHGAMELQDGLQSALAASIRRRELFMSRTSEPPTELDMRVISTPVKGDFVDLSGGDFESLPQSERWDLGVTLLDGGAKGVIFRSPYRSSGLSICAFSGEVLGRSLQTEHYRFVWDGVAIRTVYCFRDGRTILPKEIFSSEPLVERAA